MPLRVRSAAKVAPAVVRIADLGTWLGDNAIEINEWQARPDRALPGSPLPVSVVVTTRKYGARLERCLRSILASRYADLEVIVVSGQTGDGVMRALLAERFSDEVPMRCVEEPRPGLAFARNAGLAAAEGEFVAFVRADAVVDPDWVARSAQAFERDDAVACVTGSVLTFALEGDDEPPPTEAEARTFRLPDDELPLLGYTPGLIGSGANLVVHTGTARRLGGFDIDLGRATPCAAGEDLDFFLRLLHAGHAIAYEPSAIVWRERLDAGGGPAFRQGVGVGALFSKQLLRGPGRRELLRWGRAARRAAGPRPRLRWIRRAGTLLGPAAYAASVATRRTRAFDGARLGRPPMRTERVTLSDGGSVRVVSFLDVEAAPPMGLARPTIQSRLIRALVTAAAFTCLAAPLAIALGLPSALRMAAVLAFICVGAGTTLVTGPDPRLWWAPQVLVVALAALSLALLLGRGVWPRRPSASSRRSSRFGLARAGERRARPGLRRRPRRAARDLDPPEPR